MNTNASIERTTGPMFRERKQVRTFRDRQAMHEFLNKGDNSCTWTEHTLGLKSGTYAYVGGRWQNIKHLDAVLLCHV